MILRRHFKLSDPPPFKVTNIGKVIQITCGGKTVGSCVMTDNYGFDDRRFFIDIDILDMDEGFLDTPFIFNGLQVSASVDQSHHYVERIMLTRKV